ncbi:MAG: recombination mediator RecR [Parcubacteria group bacterium]
MKYPDKIERLICSFSTLPGIGRKTAERFVFFLLKRPKAEIIDFVKSLAGVESENFFCSECFNLSESRGKCWICADSRRDESIICVVEEVQDLHGLENTNEYRGLYHVLGGKIDPLEGVSAGGLNIQKLIERIKTGKVKEIILALNPDMQGEGTTLYLKKLLVPYNIKITLLGRGLPMGGDIEYADEITLTNALKSRQPLL